jgi:hypothetical protein
VRNYNPSHLSYPWNDLIKLRPQTPMDRSLLLSSKLTNALSYPSQSYFLPYAQKSANFTVRSTVHHISRQLPQLSRPNKGYGHKRDGPLQLLLNLQHHTPTPHKVIPALTSTKMKNTANFTVGGFLPHISAAHQPELPRANVGNTDG